MLYIYFMDNYIYIGIFCVLLINFKICYILSNVGGGMGVLFLLDMC